MMPTHSACTHPHSGILLVFFHCFDCHAYVQIGHRKKKAACRSQQHSVCRTGFRSTACPAACCISFISVLICLYHVTVPPAWQSRLCCPAGTIAGLLGSLKREQSLGRGCAANQPHTPRPQTSASAGQRTEQQHALELLVGILTEFIAVHGPVIVLLENLHNFDSWSWQLLLQVRRDRHGGIGWGYRIGWEMHDTFWLGDDAFEDTLLRVAGLLCGNRYLWNKSDMALMVG